MLILITNVGSFSTIVVVVVLLLLSLVFSSVLAALPRLEMQFVCVFRPLETSAELI